MANPTTNFGWVMPTTTSLVTNLPADFNTFGQGVDTSMAGLLGGTTGQILSKTSATNMAFTWINNDQGDITSVIAGNGLSGGATSGAATLTIDTAVTADLTTAQTFTNKKLSDSTTTIVDVTDATKAVKFDVGGTTAITGTIATNFTTAKTITIPDATDTLVGKATTDTLTNKTLTSPVLTTPTISTLTTAGDTVYGTGSGVLSRLGIGTAGQVLTVNSGATAPEWATPASGGGMTLISTTTMNSGNFTLSSIAQTYKHLKLVLVNVYLNTSAEFFWIRCNGDTGSNYQRREIKLTATTIAGASTIQTNHLLGQAGSLNTNITNGFANIDLYNYTATSGGQLIVSQSSGYNSADNFGYLNTGVYNKSAAITSITVGANNSFAGGTCLFYGVS